MITIDQLLESVDLYFEPRWVTKDDDGKVCLWCGKPIQRKQGFWDTKELEIRKMWCLGRFALAEFDNKPWTECIYEVPRKTIGKIEKLLEQKLTIGKTKYEYPTNAMLMGKINELVDAVNELKGGIDETYYT